MSAPTTPRDQVDALREGTGVLDLDGWLLIRVAGADAEGWLNDLVTADVASVAQDRAVRSLLLGPTGRIRADLLIHRREADVLLLQSPGQPVGAEVLLQPYVLSSEVTLEPADEAPAVLPRPGPEWVVAATATQGTVRVDDAAFDAWRIEVGLARFPVDLDPDSLPAEAGLDQAPIVDRVKGCYLGQESVAKVRNHGHPTRLVVPVLAAQPVEVGEAIVANEAEVGVLTSVEGAMAIARIRWDAKDAGLATAGGVALTRR